MSTDWIRLIPLDPTFHPGDEAAERALSFLRKMAPHAEETTIVRHERVQLFDCGVNCDRIICPSCQNELTIDWWIQQLGVDQDDEGFRMLRHIMPCCGAELTLQELIYDWPMGFGVFAVAAKNANIGKLTEESKAEFERILNTPLRVVYAHY